MNLGDILHKLTNNPFSAITPTEEKELEKIENSVKKDIRIFAQLARELFSDQRYQKLDKQFKKIYNDNVRLLIEYENEDPDKYLHKMITLQVRLRTLKSIFDAPKGFIEQEERLNEAESNKK